MRSPVMTPAMPIGAGGVDAEGGEVGLTFGDVFRVLKQRKLLVTIAFFVLYTLVVAATVVTWRWFPLYSSNAILQLLPPQEDVFAPTARLVDPKIMQLLVETEARKIDQMDVLMDVLQQEEIKRTAFYKWYDTFDECLYDFQDLVSVSAVPDTQLIQVSLSIRDPEESRQIVNMLVTRYRESYKQSSADTSVQALGDLKGTRDEVRTALAAKQSELTSYRAQTDVGALESEAEMLIRTIADQNYVVNTYDATSADLQAQLDSIAGIDPRDLPITPDERVIVEADPILRLWRQQVESLDVQIAAGLAHFTGTEHREMKRLQTLRDGYYGREVSRREELLDDLRERRVHSLKEQLARIRSIQARVQDQLEEYEARQADMDSAMVRYQTLVKEEERLQHNLEALEAKVLEFQHLVQTTPKAPRLSVVQPPKKAIQPSRPNLQVYLGGGFLLALAGACGLAFLRELTDKAIRTPIDVARHGRLSVFGAIPQLDDEEADLDEIELATRVAPHSLVSEAFRQIRANLVFSGPAESQQTLLITSPGPGNGKTATAINLAVTLANAGERVLLVDCNFRRPAIRQAFKDTRSAGLSNILIGQATLEEAATETDVANLFVLTSGPMPPTPGELLGSKYMLELIKQTRSKYQRVIFDGPPVLLISDALVVATLVDAVIVVARAADSTKGGLRRAREQLERIGAHVIGAILNGAAARPGGYYRQQYRDFYEYSSDETIPHELPGMLPADVDDNFPMDDDTKD
ncbi:MAG: polysaccharide biosynthesis tyrosine autokinase [Planctomycetota bacterium]